MQIWYKIKSLFGFYSSDIRTIKVIQNDGVEYSYDINKNILQEELKIMKPLVKSIKVI